MTSPPPSIGLFALTLCAAPASGETTLDAATGEAAALTATSTGR